MAEPWRPPPFSLGGTPQSTGMHGEGERESGVSRETLSGSVQRQLGEPLESIETVQFALSERVSLRVPYPRTLSTSPARAPPTGVERRLDRAYGAPPVTAHPTCTVFQYDVARIIAIANQKGGVGK